MENNMHRPRYSLPPQAIVGGRYLVQDFLEEQENQIIYLATDLVEKKQVRLAECYPKALVQRKGEAGEEDMIIRPRREPKVEEIQRQFENDIVRAYSLIELADEYHISKYYLSHIFKTVTGYSVMDYLKVLRIAKAKALIAKTTMSISEIVETCGFSDSSNFSRDFKSNTGLSPSDFRKKYRV